MMWPERYTGDFFYSIKEIKAPRLGFITAEDSDKLGVILSNLMSTIFEKSGRARERSGSSGR